jgi:DNA-binding protein Fis
MEASPIQLTESLKSLFKDTAEQLQGSARGQFMAKVVRELGIGGQTLAEQELGWNRGTIRKGMQEFTSGVAIQDSVSSARAQTN